MRKNAHRPQLWDTGLSDLTNAFISVIVFNNTMVEDLTMNSNNEAWRGSQGKNLTLIMGFIEFCCLQDGVVIELNVSIGTTSIASLFTTLIVNKFLFILLIFGDMFVVSGASIVACQVLQWKLAFFLLLRIHSCRRRQFTPCWRRCMHLEALLAMRNLKLLMAIVSRHTFDFLYKIHVYRGFYFMVTHTCHLGI